MADYDDAVKLLTSSGKFRISLGLERMFKIMALLDNPQDRLNCIHVAGTNGKGSVCAAIASILNAAGKKVGLYTSPHIFKYTERIQINNNPLPLGEGVVVAEHCEAYNDGRGLRILQSISDSDFTRYVFEISDLADKNDIDLTEFEILTAVMFKYFADCGVDVAVIETGLGGRFDATNIIKKNLCSVITHVDYDHTERLGNTLDKIAFEKAGIIKPNCPCIVTEGKEAYYDRAMEINSELEIISSHPLSLTLPLEGGGDCVSALRGVHQQENMSLAVAAVEKCFPEITKEQIEAGLRNVKHPCRFQYIKEKNLIIDGAHNPNGISALVQSLDLYYPNTKRRFIFGCLRNKDYEKMLNTLLSKGDEVYFYRFKHENSAAFDELQAVCPVKAKELKTGVRINFNDGKLNVICGSFYMIAELTEFLGITIS